MNRVTRSPDDGRQILRTLLAALGVTLSALALLAGVVTCRGAADASVTHPMVALAGGVFVAGCLCALATLTMWLAAEALALFRRPV